ncbi:hypothetical protein MKX79_03725 [Viridibacillus sp. FSL R5-0468]|uniref:hypothetical protein n=1 Tax=Viridibacillus sp. FSL R5-0468 TaxID=2921640 RepID=UPI0030FAB313
MLIDAINNGQSMLAHSLFVAMKKQIINGNDIAINLPFDRFPIDECLDAHKKNILSIHPIKLYAITLNNTFAFYLSKDEESVKRLHFSLFEIIPKRLIDMSEKIYTSVYDEETKKFESFEEIRDRTIEFPVFVCCMDKKRR